MYIRLFLTVSLFLTLSLSDDFTLSPVCARLVLYTVGRNRGGGRTQRPPSRHLSVLRRELHTFLLLSLVAKPHTNDILFQIQLLCYGGYLLARWPWLDGEVRLQ